MRTIIPLCIILLTGCSNSPAAPTAIDEAPPPRGTQPAPPPLTPSNLRWDRFGPGCEANTAPTPIPDPGNASLIDEGGGFVTGRWPRYEAADGRDGLLYARFVLDGGEYVLCSWDMSDL